MAAPFLVFSLPRSRSAWLSNLLTYDGAFCGHELMAEFPTPEALSQALTSSEMVFFGNADTSQSLHFERLVELMPEAKMVAIMRPVEEVMASVEKLGLPCSRERMQPFVEAMERVADAPDVLTVNYGDLSDEGVCESIVRHCCPGIWHDHKRCQMLQDFNIQITKPRWAELFKLANANVLEN